MPGNKSIYNDAVKKGHNAAWDGNWKKAVEEYRRALTEFPDDVAVRSSLAQALEGQGQWESAVHEYQRIAQEKPRDPLPLMRIAELQEKTRRIAEAAASYIAAADLFQASKQTSKVIEAWSKAAALEPDRTDLHVRLAEAYLHTGQPSLASMEHLTLAYIYRKRGDNPKAQSCAEQALKIDGRNQAARAFIEETKETDTASSGGLDSVGEAKKTALSRLAQTVLDEPSPTPPESTEERRDNAHRSDLQQIEIDMLITRAVDAQMNHRVAEAIDAYRKLRSVGISRPEINFNLGLLYFESMRYEEAVELLRDTVNDKNYALASHFALGQCYRAQGKMDNAVEHFLQVVKIVDLGSVNREQADDLISVYEGLAESYAAKGDRAKAEVFSQTLEDFLSSKGWEDKVGEVRHHLESIRSEGGQVTLAEVIEVPDSDKVLEALALAQEYIRRDKLGAAGEECYRAIELAPEYLPAHIRLAEILSKQNRLAEANEKYETLAVLCIIRGDWKRAESVYRSALKVMPDDLGNRSKLIDLLVQQDRVPDALEQYVELGDLYANQGQPAKAIEKYTEGTRLSARSNVVSPHTAMLRHRLAEVRAKQGDLKGALAVYQEIRQQSPDDERAVFYAIDLQFRLGQTTAALNDLEILVKYYSDRREPKKAISILEALLQSYPNEVGLLMQLAIGYHANGFTDKAIATLDALGESQLSAGQTAAAAVTIRKIIEWNPPRMEDYKKLLQALGE